MTPPLDWACLTDTCEAVWALELLRIQNLKIKRSCISVCSALSVGKLLERGMTMDKPDDMTLLVHDFKNQLGIILGISELLLAQISQDDSHRTDVEEIEKAAQTALRLLDRLRAALRSAAS
jgi:signal transduction histidine kinase